MALKGFACIRSTLLSFPVCRNMLFGLVAVGTADVRGSIWIVQVSTGCYIDLERITEYWDKSTISVIIVPTLSPKRT